MSIAKKNHLAEVRGEWVARGQTDSSSLCSDYVEHFLRENPAPGICWEAGVLAPLLETVSTEDVNCVAARLGGVLVLVVWVPMVVVLVVLLLLVVSIAAVLVVLALLVGVVVLVVVLLAVMVLVVDAVAVAAVLVMVLTSMLVLAVELGGWWWWCCWWYWC